MQCAVRLYNTSEMLRRVRSVPLPLALLLSLIVLSDSGTAAVGEPAAAIEEIIERFVDKETEFSKARESYTYRQTVKVLEYANSGSVRGRWDLVQDILFGVDGKRIERVVYAPPSSLRNVILTSRGHGRLA